MIQPAFASILLTERRAPGPRRRRPKVTQVPQPQPAASWRARLTTTVTSAVHRRHALT